MVSVGVALAHVTLQAKNKFERCFKKVNCWDFNINAFVIYDQEGADDKIHELYEFHVAKKSRSKNEELGINFVKTKTVIPAR